MIQADDSVALTTVRGGINRQRTKGGAPNDQLYDLLNAYVSKSKTMVPRPGTGRVLNLDEDTDGGSETRGLVSFDGALHTFCHQPVDLPAGITLSIITHPDQTPDNPIPIDSIDFAAPFMSYLYVVATFQNGETQHFWLQEGNEWESETAYKLGDVVIPSTFAGLAFQAQRLTGPNPAWQPNIVRSLGDVVEPTVYNDFYYTVVDTQGANPRSGETEPVWPTEDGAQVIEDADGSAVDAPTTPTTPDTSAVPSPTIQDRYSNIFRPVK